MNRKQNTRILIVGAGGIGSQLLDLLVPALTAGDLAERAGGVQIHIMDDDRVELANLCHQRHEPRTIGQLKVTSITQRLASHLSPALTLTPYGDKLLNASQLDGYDMVVVAVDRPEARVLVHENTEQWIDLRCGGDGMLALDDESDPALVTMMTPTDQAPASCQYPGAIESGNIQMGYALAAAHGAQWVIQRMRGSIGEPSRPTPARMYSLTFGELEFPVIHPQEIDDELAPQNGTSKLLNHGKRWTLGDETQLVMEAREGRTPTEMSESLERTPNAISQHLFKLIDFSQMPMRYLAWSQCSIRPKMSRPL